MKFGVADYGIMVWDGGLYDLETKLEMVKRIGFDGVERLIACDAGDALTKAARYRRMGLEFSTCRGPSVDRGIEWTAGLGKKYVWIETIDNTRNSTLEVFCRRANKFIAAANIAGIDAVLHNHLGSRIENQDELDYFMKACPDAKLLLDIGHLYGAGGDAVAAIRKYASRLAALHFKDIRMVDQSIGLDRWFDRLKFCELGGGNAGLVDYAGCAAALREIGYDGWVFIEHDTHTDEPEKQLKVSLNVLKQIFA